MEGADEVGQLQICAISIYLLTLVQMITSNLQLIFSMDEVNFVQQLIFSIERAYRTPDYGMWARGSKYNTNTCELHARSVDECISSYNAGPLVLSGWPKRPWRR